MARSACSREQLDRRSAHRIEPVALAGCELCIDGFNLLVTIESALAGGIVLLGRDECCRDMASVHGTYREVAETYRAARLVGAVTAEWNVAKCHWFLDSPVGNSGRLKAALETVAQEFSWNWEVSLEFSPDHILGATTEVVASSDSGVLDRCERWCNVAREVFTAHLKNAFTLDLRPDEVNR